MRVAKTKPGIEPQLPALIRDAVERHWERVALVDGQIALTFGELHRASCAAATRLRALGVEQRSTVAIRLRNSGQHLVALLGSIYAGLRIVPISDRLTTEEIRHVLKDSGARALLQEPGEEVFCPREQSESNIVVPLERDLLSAPKDVKLEDDLDRVEASFLPYTSGTTGRPKGVEMPAVSRARLVSRLVAHYGLGEEDALLASLPIAHSAGLTFALAHLMAGGKVVLDSETFSPARFASTVQRDSISTVLLVPTMLEALGRSAVAPAELEPVRRWVVTGAPLSSVTRSRFAVFLPDAPIWQYYGATESPHMTLLRPEEGANRPGSVGRPFAGVELQIRDDVGRVVTTGEIGEIWSRSPWMLEAYHDNPTATLEALRDGWYRTGDLGRLDQEGFLFLTGRKRDVIISGGLNIYPAEVEAALREHPHIAEAAVVGVPDDYWGERVVAVVVCLDQVDSEQLKDHCREHLASYKKPSEVIFSPSIPRNHMGKVDKQSILQLVLSELSGRVSG